MEAYSGRSSAAEPINQGGWEAEEEEEEGMDERGSVRESNKETRKQG